MKGTIIVASLSLALLAGCDQGAPEQSGAKAQQEALQELSGEVVYRERMAIPAESTLTVMLQDVSLQDIPARVIAEQTMTPDSAVPIPFTLRYLPSELEPGVSFAVSGQIRDAEGRLLWINTERHTVDLAEDTDSTPMTLMLHRVGEAEPAFAENDSERPGPWDLAREDGANFWATGNEPGWNLTVYPQRELVLVTDYGSHTDRVDDPGPQVEGDHIHYHSEGDTLTLMVDIYKEPCQDSMSGEQFAYSVRLVRNEQELAGCGRDL